MPSPLETLLNQTLPRFLGQEISNLRSEARFQAQEEKAEKRYIQEWNRSEGRYQDQLRVKREERNEERDRILISRGLREPLDKRVQYFNNLVDSGRMKSTFGYDLLEGEISHASSEFGRANASIQGLDIYKLNNFEYTHLENQYLSGEFDKAFETLDKVIDRKVDPKMNPALNASVKNIQAQIEFLNKTLVDPYNILDNKKKIELRGQRDQLQIEQSKLLTPLSFLKGVGGEGGEGGKLDSTDWNILQINDKVFDPTSQKFFGKPVRRLSSEEHIRLGAWISKNSPRQIGKTKSGWNNWTVFWKKDEKTGEELYKKHLNKSDAYYMSGGLSKSDLELINQEFGKDAPIAKAVMMAESGGKYGAINQNFSGGRSKTGQLSSATPFSPQWNLDATSYLASSTGLSPEEFHRVYGKNLQTFINKMNRQGITGDRANTELEKFASKLKRVEGATPKLKMTVPSGKFQGKKFNKTIVEQLLKQRDREDWREERRKGKILYGMTAGAKYEWLDTFAQELGFDTAEGLLTKEGVKAMKDYYGGGMTQAGEIDFTQPYTLTR
mgnify:FL=1